MCNLVSYPGQTLDGVPLRKDAVSVFNVTADWTIYQVFLCNIDKFHRAEWFQINNNNDKNNKDKGHNP